MVDKDNNGQGDSFTDKIDQQRKRKDNPSEEKDKNYKKESQQQEQIRKRVRSLSDEFKEESKTDEWHKYYSSTPKVR